MTELQFEQISERLWQQKFPVCDTVIGIATGGVIPASLIAHQLKLPLEIIQIQFRKEDNSPQYDEPKIFSDIPQLKAKTKILLVDDVAVSGQTLETAKKLLAEFEITTCVMKGSADIVLFPEIYDCISWPWKLQSKNLCHMKK